MVSAISAGTLSYCQPMVSDTDQPSDTARRSVCRPSFSEYATSRYMNRLILLGERYTGHMSGICSPVGGSLQAIGGFERFFRGGQLPVFDNCVRSLRYRAEERSMQAGRVGEGVGASVCLVPGIRRAGTSREFRGSSYYSASSAVAFLMMMELPSTLKVW